MPCHICSHEAIDRCYTCGQLFCERHGKINCVRCATGFMPGDRRSDRLSAVLLIRSNRPGWWLPQPADDFEPPTCHVCHTLARLRCRNCGEIVCSAHVSRAGLCRTCIRSARVGGMMLVMLFLSLGLLIIFSLMQSSII